jgi:hypothetical protein
MQRFSACIRELGTKQALFFIVAGTSIVPFAPTRAMHDSRYSALTEVLQKLHLVNAQDATSPCLHLEQEQLFREAFDTFSLTLLLERVSDIRARSISVHTVPIEFIVKCVLVFAQALSDALDEKLHRRCPLPSVLPVGTRAAHVAQVSVPQRRVVRQLPNHYQWLGNCPTIGNG